MGVVSVKDPRLRPFSLAFGASPFLRSPQPTKGHDTPNSETGRGLGGQDQDPEDFTPSGITKGCKRKVLWSGTGIGESGVVPFILLLFSTASFLTPVERVGIAAVETHKGR